MRIQSVSSWGKKNIDGKNSTGRMIDSVRIQTFFPSNKPIISSAQSYHRISFGYDFFARSKRKVMITNYRRYMI